MRPNALFLVAASLSGVALGQICTASDLVGCLEAPLSMYTCTDLSCACTQINLQTACYTSLCPEDPLPTYIQAAYSSACGQPAGNGGPAAATTTAVGAAPTNTASAGSAGSTPTATGTAQPASTSKAAGNVGFVASGGSIMAAVLAVLAYL